MAVGGVELRLVQPGAYEIFLNVSGAAAGVFLVLGGRTDAGNADQRFEFFEKTVAVLVNVLLGGHDLRF